MANSEQDIRARLTAIFHDVFDDDEIVLTDEMTAADVEDWDSLSHINLVVVCEKEFGVRLAPAEVGKLENVGAMIRLLVERATS
jgi:acyl carrier protein